MAFEDSVAPRRPPFPVWLSILVLTLVGALIILTFPFYNDARTWQAREARLTGLTPEERKSFDNFEHILRHVMEPGDVLVIQSSRDGQIFTRTLQSRSENGDLTFLESNRSGKVLVVHSPENTASLLQIFGQLISIKMERNFYAPETTTKPSPPSAVEGFLIFHTFSFVLKFRECYNFTHVSCCSCAYW